MPPLTDPTMSTPSIVLNAHFSPRANPHGCAFLVNLVLIVKPECCRARQTNPPAARPGTRQAASQTARPAALQATRPATSPVPEPAVTPRGGGIKCLALFKTETASAVIFLRAGISGKGVFRQEPAGWKPNLSSVLCARGFRQGGVPPSQGTSTEFPFAGLRPPVDGSAGGP